MGAPLLAAAAAAFRYGSDGAFVGPFSFAAHAGEMHLIGGPSGCGKSTLARMLTGIVPHLYRGELRGDVEIDGHSSGELALWRISTRAGLVSQNPAAQLLGSTVRDEVVFGLENLGLDEAEIRARTDEVLAELSLYGMAERSPHTLSGGEQQRLVLASIAARRPLAIVLDEPLSMLDAASASAVVRRLDRLRASGTAVVVFEHRERAFARLDGVTRRSLPGRGEEPAASLPEPARETAPFRVVVRDLRVRLGGHPAVDGVDLDLAGGRVVSLIGANGAGKTTLLRALSGLQPHEGTIDREGASAQRAVRLGLCFQNPDRQLFNSTVREEILFGLDRWDEEFYRVVVGVLGLAPYERHSPLLLSEGEKKRLALATVIVRPGLDGICLDEPTLGQDARHAHLVGGILRRLAAAGRLCVVATHDLEWAAAWSDEIVLLDAGRVAARERPEAIDRRPGPWVRRPQGTESTCEAANPSS